MLALAEPLVVVACMGVCNAAGECGRVVRGLMMTVRGRDDAAGGKGWESMKGWEGKEGCAMCGRVQDGLVRKCAGCGVVGYCGERCQRKGWKAGHRWECGKGKGGGEEGGRDGDGGREEEKKGKEEEVEVPDPEDELWEE